MECQLSEAKYEHRMERDLGKGSICDQPGLGYSGNCKHGRWWRTRVPPMHLGLVGKEEEELVPHFLRLLPLHQEREEGRRREEEEGCCLPRQSNKFRVWEGDYCLLLHSPLLPPPKPQTSLGFGSGGEEEEREGLSFGLIFSVFFFIGGWGFFCSKTFYCFSCFFEFGGGEGSYYQNFNPLSLNRCRRQHAARVLTMACEGCGNPRTNRLSGGTRSIQQGHAVFLLALAHLTTS